MIEGVMMRSPWRVATAVREPEGGIRVKSYPFTSAAKTHKLWKLPVFRGMAGLYEAMKIGMETLNWAAEIAGEEDPSRKETWWDRILTVLSSLVAFVFAIGLFMAVPYAVAGLLPTAANQVHFHLLAGTLRVALLIGYMAAISLIPDIKRVFCYHGAEHKSIFTFEGKLDLTVGNAKDQSRLHPRCGTSFLLLTAVLTMIGFMTFDSIWVLSVGQFSNIFHRILIHLPVIPLIAGLSYEALRIIEKHSDDPKWSAFVKPGFWLQRITTSEPDEGQLEVALVALEAALDESAEVYEGPAKKDAESKAVGEVLNEVLDEQS